MGASQKAAAGKADQASIAFACTLVALGVGIAIDINGGGYSPAAMLALTLTICVFILGIALPTSPGSERFFGRMLAFALPAFIIVEATLLLHRAIMDARTSGELGITLRGIFYPMVLSAISFLAILALLQSTKLGEYRQPMVCVMAMMLFLLGWFYIEQGYTKIDVVMFQETGATALLHGDNPYTIRYPNVYEPDTPYYGPGVIDASGKWLTYGLPYLPWSLLMSLPGSLVGDCRYSDVASAALTGFLIYAARPGRTSALAAGVFMLTPQGLHVLFYGWTEPLLALTFALAMYCACRWPRLLPYALGLFLATKQYAVLSLPAMWLLTEGENRWKSLGGVFLRAGSVAVAITMPFFLWNPHGFFRSVVQLQIVQPFFRETLSYLVLIYNSGGTRMPLMWIPLLATSGAMALALWRCPHTPAGFAAAVTLIDLVFFAFNKYAFCNYYYFVIVTACFAIGMWTDRNCAPDPILRA